jgi:hypothetical protein
MRIKIKRVNASAGSRTRVYWLEGNYPNRWTKNALLIGVQVVYIC